MEFLKDINLEELKKGTTIKKVVKTEAEIAKAEKIKNLKQEIFDFLKENFNPEFSVKKFNSLLKSKIENDEDLKELKITYITFSTIKKIEKLKVEEEEKLKSEEEEKAKSETAKNPKK